MSEHLKTYTAKRNFNVTPEPAAGGAANIDAPSFVIQKHWASRLHYDFRLEIDGTMKSWAVPKGPSFDPKEKRMAVHVEDHPLAYAGFEGDIPEGEYGGGKVIVWDKGSWQPIGDPRQGYADGHLKFELHGHKLHGRWVLVRIKDKSGKTGKQEPWLLIKEQDDYARPAALFSVIDEYPDSVANLPPPQDSAPAHHAAEAVGQGERAELPASLAPQLATLVDAPPSTPHDWLFEVKFDGYRLLARIERGQVRLFTRNANDWTAKLKPLQRALEDMHLPDGWYDGEIVVHDDSGRPDFGLLQQAFDGERTHDIVYFLFDLPFCDGYDLRALPVEQRRARLRNLLEAQHSETVRFSQELGSDPESIIAAACKLGLEGIIGKRRDAPYASRRALTWIKLKCGQQQEFIIAGYTERQGARVGFGSLVLATNGEDGRLHYVGNVGTGFDDKTLHTLKARLAELETDRSPFPPKTVPGREPHWVQPVLVAQVRFAEWTRGGSVRHASFQGLREDKPAAAITREKAVHMDADPQLRLASTLPSTLKVSHGERVVDAQTGITKMALVRYYALVGNLIMTHLKQRPVSLVRATQGVGGPLFFQKHADVDKLPGVKQLDPELDPGHPAMLEIATIEGVLSAAQWNVIEFHTQNARGKAYETPDRIVFDLDPGEGVDWRAMQLAARTVHGFLDALGLASFLKTSGGKGLHVVAPIRPGHSWDTVKALSQAVVRHLASTIPERFAFKSGARNRVGRIFVDYLRNGRGATTVCAWSARVRPGLGISVPLSWDELDEVGAGDQWNVRNVHTRLDVGNAPWNGYARSARKIDAALKQLDVKPV